MVEPEQKAKKSILVNNEEYVAHMEERRRSREALKRYLADSFDRLTKLAGDRWTDVQDDVNHILRVLKKVRYEPANAYSSGVPGGSATTDYYYDKVFCDGCKDPEAGHRTCENCGFHGVFDQYDCSAGCPKCNWGNAT